MGIDKSGLSAILMSQKYVKNFGKMITLGRQQIHTAINLGDNIRCNYGDYCERFFQQLGFKQVDSIDNSSYENAKIIHNMNLPIPSGGLKYDYIYDGGTTEHIFNAPQVCENIINMLEVGGILCSVTVNNNFSGHGMYQFSPEFFLSVYTKKYGMEIQELYIAQNGRDVSTWINVNDFNRANGGRQCAKFDTTEEVYIISIIKKVSDVRESLITSPPNQYSYESVDWVKT